MKMQDAAPLLQKLAPLPLPPFLLNDVVYDLLAENIPPSEQIVQPLPSWAFARKRESGEKLPLTIAHRGYKAKHPENTLDAFKGAVKAGAHALETDIHTTKDDVLVLSHDATLKRCFGKEEKIANCTWEYISQQKTLQEPHEPMPRFQDLLEYLASPGLENIWLLLDIKLDNDASTVMRLIAQAIQSTPPSPSRPWSQRIVLGIWAAKYLPLCSQHLPAFSITHIGFSISYSRQFLSVPHISFNILQKSLLAPFFGRRFLRDAKAQGRPVFVWTVNEESMMRWSIGSGVDGVITDDPKRFLEVCGDWEEGKREVRKTRAQWVGIVWINFMVLVFGAIFYWKYGGVDKRKQKTEGGEEEGGEEGGESIPSI